MMGRFLQNLFRIFLVLLLATIGAGSAGAAPSNWSQTELLILQQSIFAGNTDPTNTAPTDLTKALALSGKNVGATDGLITDSGNFRALDGTKVLSASLNFLHSSNATNRGLTGSKGDWSLSGQGSGQFIEVQTASAGKVTYSVQNKVNGYVITKGPDGKPVVFGADPLAGTKTGILDTKWSDQQFYNQLQKAKEFSQNARDTVLKTHGRELFMAWEMLRNF